MALMAGATLEDSVVSGAAVAAAPDPGGTRMSVESAEARPGQ